MMETPSSESTESTTPVEVHEEVHQHCDSTQLQQHSDHSTEPGLPLTDDGNLQELSTQTIDSAPISECLVSHEDHSAFTQQPLPSTYPAHVESHLLTENFAQRPVGYERAQRREKERKDSVLPNPDGVNDGSERLESCDGVPCAESAAGPDGPDVYREGRGEERYEKVYTMLGGLFLWPSLLPSAESSPEEQYEHSSVRGPHEELQKHTDQAAMEDLAVQLQILNLLYGHIGGSRVYNEATLKPGGTGDKKSSDNMNSHAPLDNSNSSGSPDNNKNCDRTDSVSLCRSSTGTELSSHSDGMLCKNTDGECNENVFVEPTPTPDEDNTAQFFQWDTLMQQPDDQEEQCLEESETRQHVHAVQLAQQRVRETDKYGNRHSIDSGVGSLSELVYFPGKTSVTSSPPRRVRLPSLRWNDAHFCPDHHDQLLRLYCTDCCRLICYTCYAYNHMDCPRVLTPNLACRDVRWQLLKLQSRVSSQISGLERQVEALKPLMDEGSRKTKESKEKLNEQFHQILKQLENKHRDLMAQLEVKCRWEEHKTKDLLQTAEKSLVLLNYVSKFLEVLRQRDSAWELLDTYDMRLSHLLQRVMQSATSLESSPSWEVWNNDTVLSESQLTALQVAVDGLEIGATRKSGFAGDWSLSDQMYPTKACDDSDLLMSEILSYMNRFPPPTPAGMPSVNTSELHVPACLEDLDDDVFQGESTGQERAPDNPQEAALDTAAQSSAVATVPTTAGEYRVDQRLRPDFPQDEQKPFITDIHVTDTGHLVLLDAANNCLKRVNPRQPSHHPYRLHVQQPISVCSAGWERVLVSRAGRLLSVYEVGGQHVRMVASRYTRQQYQGLARASDALAAAASPENHSVDLLDFSGRVLRSIVPVDFIKGPNVVGSTTTGELLVIYQPPVPPTTIVCFDMKGRVLWQHELHVRDRHVTCSRIVGGADGSVYYVLHGDSAIFRYSPKDDAVDPVLSAVHGIKLPTTLALDSDGRVVVSRSEMTTSTNAAKPVTTEIDCFTPLVHRANK